MSYYDPYQQPYQYSSPPAYQPYPGYPGYPPPARGTNTLAIVSLIVSLVGFFVLGGLACPVGAILGHMAKGQIKQSGEEGDGLAMAGIIVGWVGTGLACLTWGVFILFFGLIGGMACISAGSTDYEPDPTPTFELLAAIVHALT